jgi:hypothetical protein
MAASPNQRPQDTVIAKAGADSSSTDAVNSRTPLSRFTDTALTTSQDSFAKEKERAQGSVDMKGMGLHKFQIAENASAMPAPVSINNQFAEKSFNGRHVEARTYDKVSIKEIPNPFDRSVRFEPAKPVEKMPSPPVTTPVEVTSPQAAPPLERPRFDMEHPFEQPAKSVELHNLRNGSGQRETADAVVRVPDNFDPTKPIHLVVYNHGYGDTASSSYANAKLDQQFHDAPPNTILIVPEWQASPASRTGTDGRFGENGRFKNLVDEAFSKTPGLQGLNTNNIDSIALIGHSAGFKDVERELYNNGLSSKVNSVTMLDAMYDPTGMDTWLRNNIHALSDGSKRFVNVSNDTFPQSRAQAGRIKEMLRAAGLPSSNVYEDYNNSGSVMDLNKLQQHSIAFKYSEATVPGKGEHMSIPNLYIRRVTLAGL